jgi:pimeloyl-ACP methyl ester carboxylesterase
LVQPGVARFTRVCSYDRAGFGWSAEGRAPRSSQQIAEELAALLSKADVKAPYALVGHSLGGLYVRAFARKFPEQVAGMVLVDSTHEDQWTFEPRRFWEPAGTPQLRYVQPEVERPKAVEQLLREMWATERWKSGERAEREAIGLSVSDAQKESKRLPAIPLIVLSSGIETTWLDRASMGALKAQQLQREMAAFSPLGKWRPVPGANHYIHLSQPAAVVEAVREIIQSVREMRPVKDVPAPQP